MRKKKPYQILTFHTTSAAMAMELYCKEHGISGRLIPVPRELSAGCGLAWRIEPVTKMIFLTPVLKSNKMWN